MTGARDQEEVQRGGPVRQRGVEVGAELGLEIGWCLVAFMVCLLLLRCGYFLMFLMLLLRYCRFLVLLLMLCMSVYVFVALLLFFCMVGIRWRFVLLLVFLVCSVVWSLLYVYLPFVAFFVVVSGCLLLACLALFICFFVFLLSMFSVFGVVCVFWEFPPSENDQHLETLHILFLPPKVAAKASVLIFLFRPEGNISAGSSCWGQKPQIRL